MVLKLHKDGSCAARTPRIPVYLCSHFRRGLEVCVLPVRAGVAVYMVALRLVGQMEDVVHRKRGKGGYVSTFDTSK